MVKRKKPTLLVRDREHGDLLACGECHASFFAGGNFAHGRLHDCAQEQEWRLQHKKEENKKEEKHLHPPLLSTDSLWQDGKCGACEIVKKACRHGQSVLISRLRKRLWARTFLMKMHSQRNSENYVIRRDDVEEILVAFENLKSR